jgi:hypothetical protein
MTFALKSTFVREARLNVITYVYNGRSIEVSQSNARSPRYPAVLVIHADGEPVGYLTEWSDREMGLVPSRVFGIVSPSIHSDLDSALSHLGLL